MKPISEDQRQIIKDKEADDQLVARIYAIYQLNSLMKNFIDEAEDILTAHTAFKYVLKHTCNEVKRQLRDGLSMKLFDEKYMSIDEQYDFGEVGEQIEYAIKKYFQILDFEKKTKTFVPLTKEDAGNRLISHYYDLRKSPDCLPKREGDKDVSIPVLVKNNFNTVIARYDYARKQWIYNGVAIRPQIWAEIPSWEREDRV